MEVFAALLTYKPDVVDFGLFEPSSELNFVKFYYDKFKELPEIAVFEKETGTELPRTFAPWAFYENKLKGEKFIKDALPILTRFNDTYEKDQKQALIDLREKLVSIADPTVSLEPVSVIRDLSRFDYFRSVDNTRMPTGIKPLDDISGGISKSDEFMLITARLGIGKSWVAQFVAKSMCEKGYRVGLYSGEMSEHEVGARIDTLVSHLSNYALTRGKDIDLTDHYKQLSEIEGELLVITQRQIGHIATPQDLKLFVKSYSLDCVVIDQISLMAPNVSNYSRLAYYEQVTELSKQLKNLQQQLRIPVIAVNQLNREAASQEADAAHLAGSDQLGRDATLIISLSRTDTDVLRMKVLKCRSFKMPDQPWEFTWDIDKGILEPRLSGMDAVKAKVTKAKAVEASKSTTTANETSSEEIW